MPWLLYFDRHPARFVLVALFTLLLAGLLATAVAVLAPDSALVPNVLAGWMWRPDGWMW